MHFKITIIAVLISVTLSGARLKKGIYRATLMLDSAGQVVLPFNFEVSYRSRKPVIVIRNAGERITVNEITIKGDSVNFKMPVFDTEFRTRWNGDELEGVWINHYRKNKNIIPFKAEYGNSARFTESGEKKPPLFGGKWEVTFSPDKAGASKAVGIFHHEEQTENITGTFLTETGDYRYLEGKQAGNRIYLSCFDGSHAFLFKAEFREGEIVNGMFYSGSHWQETWKGKRNDGFGLRNPVELTSLKGESAKVNFSFPDLDSSMVSLSDKEFQNKPMIIQIMGTWCPNCMDESVYLSELNKRYAKDGLVIVALAFEKANNFSKARQQVVRFKKRLEIDYKILVTLKTGKDQAAAALPFLDGITAFPTTLFLNRNHEVVRIHTGFSGPATGNEFLHFKAETENLINNLLKD